MSVDPIVAIYRLQELFSTIECAIEIRGLPYDITENCETSDLSDAAKTALKNGKLFKDFHPYDSLKSTALVVLSEDVLDLVIELHGYGILSALKPFARTQMPSGKKHLLEGDQ